MDMQNVSNLQISEGAVRTIHDKDNRLIWGRLAYDTKYVGNSEQRNLPKGYTQVLGIRADSANAYFDIATTIGTDDSFEYSYSISIAKAPVHWGYRGAINYDSANTFNGTFTGEGKLVVFASSSSVNTNTKTTEPLDSDTRLDFKYDGDTETASIPGYTFAKSSGFAPDIEPPQNHFVLNGAYVTSNNSYMPSTAGNIIYRFKSAECDIYPCVRDSDGKVGLYDVKRNIFIPPTAGTFTVVTGDVVPTPDTPIPVQVVTGEQTITISDGVGSEDFAISLGSTELCKIGDYQDYIYKSGSDWYVHKEIGKYTFASDDNWSTITYGTNSWGLPNKTPNFVFDTSQVNTICEISKSVSFNNRASEDSAHTCVCYMHSNGTINIRNTSITTKEAMQSAAEGADIYYWRTPEDTEITDNTLISQLNAIHQFLTRYGYSSTVSGNLPLIISKTNL